MSYTKADLTDKFKPQSQVIIKKRECNYFSWSTNTSGQAIKIVADEIVSNQISYKSLNQSREFKEIYDHVENVILSSFPYFPELFESQTGHKFKTGVRGQLYNRVHKMFYSYNNKNRASLSSELPTNNRLLRPHIKLVLDHYYKNRVFTIDDCNRIINV